MYFFPHSARPWAAEGLYLHGHDRERQGREDSGEGDAGLGRERRLPGDRFQADGRLLRLRDDGAWAVVGHPPGGRSLTPDAASQAAEQLEIRRKSRVLLHRELLAEPSVRRDVDDM